MLRRCFAGVGQINVDVQCPNCPGWKLLPSLYSAYINGNATYNYIVFIYGSLLVVESFFLCNRGFCVFTCLPYEVLCCIFTNFSVMSAKDMLETYLQLEAYHW